MKKVLSFILCLTMVLSLLTVAGVTVSAEEADLAETGPIFGSVDIGTGFNSRFWFTRNNTRYNLSAHYDYEDGDSIEMFNRIFPNFTERWRFDRQSDGSYKIFNLGVKKYLSYYANNGSSVCADTTDANDPDITWYITGSDSDGFQLQPVKNTGLWLRVDYEGYTASDDVYFKTLSLTNNKSAEGTRFGIMNCKNYTTVPTPYFELAPRQNGVLIDWSEYDFENYEYVTDYRVYRYDDANKKWITLTDSIDTNYLDETAVSGNTYKYTVKATSPYNSAYQAKSITFCKPPVLKYKVTDDGSLNFYWNKVAGAGAYRVMYGNLDIGESTVGRTRGTSLTVKGKYYGDQIAFFAVCTSADGKTDYSADGAELYPLYAPNPAFKVALMPDGYKLTWNDVLEDLSDDGYGAAFDGNGYYRVFYSCKDTGNKWRKVADVGRNTSYQFKGLKAGMQYKFTVRVMKKGANVPGSGFTPSGTYTFYPAPKVTKWKKLANGAYQLTWQKGIGAVKYRAYGWNGTKWVTLGDTDKTYGNLRDMKTGTNPIYAIRSLNSKGKLISGYWENILILKNGSIRYFYPPTWAK